MFIFISKRDAYKRSVRKLDKLSIHTILSGLNASEFSGTLALHVTCEKFDELVIPHNFLSATSESEVASNSNIERWKTLVGCHRWISLQYQRDRILE